MNDASLARAAREGDGRAFATLYDRHERRVYGFCLRMLGRPEDAADATQETFVRVLRRLPGVGDDPLNVIVNVLGAARDTCYDMLGRRNQVDLVGGHETLRTADLSGLLDDPERQSMLDASRQLVAAVHDALPERQREVLALRELESRSYDEIASLMGIKATAVAQLISRGRINLRNGVRGAAPTSVRGEGPDCDRALPLLAAVQDDQAAEIEDLAWLQAHMADCASCRARREAMDEAGVSYRMLVPIIPLLWLRHAAIARAADAVGANWREVADEQYGLGGSDPLWDRLGRHRVAITAAMVMCTLVVLVFGAEVTSDRGHSAHELANSTLTTISATTGAVAGTSTTSHGTARHRSGHAVTTPAANQFATVAAGVLTTIASAPKAVAGTSVPAAGTAGPKQVSAPQTTVSLGSRTTGKTTTGPALASPVTATSAVADTDSTPTATTTTSTGLTQTVTTPAQTDTTTTSTQTGTATQPTTTDVTTSTVTVPTTTCPSAGRCKEKSGT